MNNNYKFQFIRMLFIYVPNILLFLVWSYFFHLNIFLCLIITPLSYLGINGGLVYYKQFNLVHQIMDSTIILPITETQLSNIVLFIFRLINKISYVNKFYAWVKVKILLSIFNMIANVVPAKKTNVLTEELQNDYLEILNKNRKRKQVNFTTDTITE